MLPCSFLTWQNLDMVSYILIQMTTDFLCPGTINDTAQGIKLSDLSANCQNVSVDTLNFFMFIIPEIKFHFGIAFSAMYLLMV
jgi:hypothetical protein